MENLVSVIIPVYNGEKYLDKCIQSVLRQTYSNIEVIIVDDGSNDSSAFICDKWRRKDPRIKVIRQDNQGVSLARMNGLNASAGDYIAFVDVDDLLKDIYIEKLYRKAVECEADIVCCDCIEIENNYKGKQLNRFHNVIEDRVINNKKDYYRDYFEKKEFYGYVVWGKIIRKELAIKEKFSTIKYGEDLQYMFKLFSHSPKTVLISYAGYEYIRWGDSVTQKTSLLEPEKLMDEIHVADTLLDICFQMQDKTLYKKATERYCSIVCSTLSMCVKFNRMEFYISKKTELKEAVIKALKLKKGKILQRLQLDVYAFSPEMYWKIMKLKYGR